ncbi:MAG: hypothetical protein JXJ04_00015 [Spirochaetales bacterium]|nr:hypothetical protein [Spirochaetales bacterium]
MEKKLFEVIDFILNHATENELVAVRAAIDRRSKGKLSTGKSLSDMVTASASAFQEQMTVPMNQIRSTVKNMVVRLIKENAPEITDEQLNALVNEWVPDRTKKKTTANRNQIPDDVLITMITQFISFSIGKMKKAEDIKLRNEMPDWPAQYWNAFPETIQMSITAFLRAQIDEEDFWKEVYRKLE